ncbi:MAG: transcription elongation factor GreA [Treponema sp.]|jgi:transcription elongation factor GreA|nr:transcription elongation factor GreA [Treponema sp.]
MSEELLKNVQKMLTEEKWTRATLNNYSTNHFKDLDVILKEAQEKKTSEELKEICDDHLGHTKTSIIALYLSGMVSLSRQIIDDTALINLVTIFADNHKWNIVQYLCERILDFGESKFALRALADCYRNTDEEQKAYAVWERLVKVDRTEADVAKALAEHFEAEGDADSCVDYYKKALHRYINKQLFTNVREIWQKLLEYCPEDLDFFLHAQKKTAKNISEEKAVLLLQDVYAACKKRNDIGAAISILKIILEYDEKDYQARREIIDCYRKKYITHSQLDEYIRISNLNQNYRNVHDAIKDFEKHIVFDKGNFVYHKTWGVGRIAGIKDDEITIDFARKRNHAMSLKMSVSALQTLTKDHIWVLKATWKKEKLTEKVKADVEWALKTVIKSFDNACDLKKIKAELSPSALSAGEWTGWSAKAKTILKTAPCFGVSPEDVDVWTVREHPISIEEKLYNEFKAKKNFFDRVKTIEEFAAQKEVEFDGEYWTEIFSYFTGFLKFSGYANEQVVASYLIVKDLAGKFPMLGSGVSINFVDIFEAVSDVPEVFSNLKDARLKEDFLRHIKLFITEWADVYAKLFPHALLPSVITALEREGYEDKLVSMTAHCFDNYRKYRAAAVWLFKNSAETPWFRKADVSFERQLLTLIHILDVSHREIENHSDTIENRKIFKQVYGILFKDGTLNSFIDEAEQDAITRIYTLVNDVKSIDPVDKLKLRSRILDKRPDFKFISTDVKKEKLAVRSLIVTAAKYEEKQRQLVHIMDVEVPANSKEIEYALSLGDLRENAEYKAAKEKQELLNSAVAKLKDEIERAQLFDPYAVDMNRVSFGVKVELEHNGKTEEYVILGPWESDPENRVISYLSPFGAALLNKTLGEQFVFAVGADKVSYTVKRIEPAAI